MTPLPDCGTYNVATMQQELCNQSIYTYCPSLGSDWQFVEAKTGWSPEPHTCVNSRCGITLAWFECFTEWD